MAVASHNEDDKRQYWPRSCDNRPCICLFQAWMGRIRDGRRDADLGAAVVWEKITNNQGFSDWVTLRVPPPAARPHLPHHRQLERDNVRGRRASPSRAWGTF